MAAGRKQRVGQIDSGRLLTQNEGLPGNMALDVLDDFEGNLWVETARAIARMSREKWTAYAEGQTNRVDTEIFTEADGLNHRNRCAFSVFIVGTVPSTASISSWDCRWIRRIVLVVMTIIL